MNPIVLALGKVLRLVGISSPEDNIRKPRVTTDPPSWRDPSLERSQPTQNGRDVAAESSLSLE